MRELMPCICSWMCNGSLVITRFTIDSIPRWAHQEHEINDDNSFSASGHFVTIGSFRVTWEWYKIYGNDSWNELFYNDLRSERIPIRYANRYRSFLPVVEKFRFLLPAPQVSLFFLVSSFFIDYKIWATIFLSQRNSHNRTYLVPNDLIESRTNERDIVTTASIDYLHDNYFVHYPYLRNAIINLTCPWSTHKWSTR